MHMFCEKSKGLHPEGGEFVDFSNNSVNVHEKQLEDIEETGEDTIPEEEKEDSKVIEGI